MAKRSTPLREGRLGPTSTNKTLSTLEAIMRAIERANVALEADDAELVSVKLTPHSLRHTTSSVRAALNDDPRFIADVLGHADVRFTFNVYAKAVARGEAELEALRALVHGAPIDAEQAVAQSVSVVRQAVQ